MSVEATLFDVEDVAAVFDVPVDLVVAELGEPRDDGTAWASCRYCQGLTTADGISNRGHGPGSRECERIRAWEERP